MGIGNRATEPARIGNLEFDAILELMEEMAADVPSYATEAGFSVGDSIIQKPTELSVSGVFSNSPVTWASRHSPNQNRVREAIRELRAKFTSGSLFTYYQNGERYDNMALTGLSIPDKADEHGSVTVKLTMKQITVTTTQTTLVTLSFPRGGTSNTNTGSTSATRASSGSGSSSGGSGSSGGNGKSQSSILYSAGSAVGLW